MRMPKDRVDPEVEKKKARQQTYETVVIFVMVCGLIRGSEFYFFFICFYIFLLLKFTFSFIFTNKT